MERAELINLLRATGCAVEHGGFVFLADPQWGAAQRARLDALKSKIENQNSEISPGWLCIPTGGTSGGLRFARHDERTLTAAVRGFCAHFEIERVNAVDVLPAHHVSGLMARVRCAATGGRHVAWNWKDLEGGNYPVLDQTRDGWVISLVATQLQRLLAVPGAVAWLKNFRIIFVGGGPVWPELAEAAARAELPLSLSYGLTETAAMVTALRPAEFLAGARSSGTALPHASIMLDSTGLVIVKGGSVFRGYFPDLSESRQFVTDDLGRIDEQGYLYLLGRRDTVIITGGKKVYPDEVENLLRASGEFTDVAVIGVPDAEWGEAVIACYPAGGRLPDFKRAVENLAGYQRPKRFVAVAKWPRNAQAKMDQAVLRAAAEGKSLQ